MEKSVAFTAACANEIIPSINRSFVYTAKEGRYVRINSISVFFLHSGAPKFTPGVYDFVLLNLCCCCSVLWTIVCLSVSFCHWYCLSFSGLQYMALLLVSSGFLRLKRILRFTYSGVYNSNIPS